MSLDVRSLTVVFSRAGRSPVPAVVNVSLHVEPGQIVGLVGELGSGKSTLGRTAVGLIRPTDGEVVLNGRPVHVIRGRARAREELGLQMVFQNPLDSLNPRRRVGRQIGDGFGAAGVRGPLRIAKTDAILEQLGLAEGAAAKYPHQFSGGQAQRIAIARALAVSPEIIVLDEPLASLDASAQAQLANLLRELADDRKVGMLLISHDLAIVRHIADEVVVMYLGTVVESASTSTLWSLPLHPYTEALIGAIPRPDGKGTLPVAMPGEVGDPANPPPGCRFHPRCPYAYERCSVETPPLITTASGRSVACWLQQSGVAPRPPASQHPTGLGEQVAGAHAAPVGATEP